MTNLPKIDPNHLCDVLQLCSLRKDNNDNQFIAIKKSDGTVIDCLAKDIIYLDEFEGVKIHRIYSSGHVFLSDDCSKIYLIETTKRATSQWQFTGGSPKEESMKDAICKKGGDIKFDLQMVELNAETRTKKRTGVDVVDVYNELPTIDRALIWNHDKDTGKKWRNLVCLMHYHVKAYKGKLTPKIGVEYVTNGKWFELSELESMSNIAPNVGLVVGHFSSK